MNPPRALATVLLLLIPCIACAVDVSGNLTTRTWTKAQSPYRITGKVTVLPGETLTIGPGVDILFDADVQFHVRGRILALGAPLDSVRFLKGAAPRWGGMRIIRADTSVFRYVRLSDAHRRDASDNWEDISGGAVFVDSSAAVTMSNTVISNNIADGYGGGICVAHTKTTLTDCTIADNSAAEYGGGLSNNYGTAVLTMVNSLVVGNTAVKYGGAIENWGAKTEILNCVFFGNVATVSGGTADGSMVVNWGTNPSLTVRNSIVWGNTPTSAIRVDAGTVTATYCDIQGGRTGTGNIKVDPLFVNAAARDFRLQSGSPCVNTGDPASPFDRDGSHADMGIDWSSRSILYGDVSGDSTISAQDAALVLRRVVDGAVTLAAPLAGDVTGNGALSAFDAALILRKVMNPTYRFPIESGAARVASTAGAPRRLYFERNASSWLLRMDDPSGVVSGDLVLMLADDSPAQAAGGLMSSYRQEGRTFVVSFVRQDDASSLLISLLTPSETAPVIARASLNEGGVAAALPGPASFALAQNVPNPFNPTTLVGFTTPDAGDVRLTIFTAHGQLVRTLVDRPLSAGEHRVVWDGRDGLGREVASGTYIARLNTAQGVLTRRMTLVR